MYREIYFTKRLVEDHARQILSLVTKCRFWDVSEHDECEWRPNKPGFCRTIWTEPEPEVIVADHDAEDRATFERHLGLSTTAAHKAKQSGIQLVQSRIKPAGDGKPRLFLCRDALVERDMDLEGRKLPCCTEEEVGAYVWAKTVKGDEKEDPLDKDNHGMDAKRYVVAYEDGGFEPNIRFLGGRRR
jgi:phage terminase large subunit